MSKELLESAAAAPGVPPLAEATARRLQELRQMFVMSETASAAERRGDEQVSEIARVFLSANGINTAIELKRLADNFRDSMIPEEPTPFEDYLNYLGDNVVFHSINTSSPRFIGHMASALPFYVRPLGKLMMAINQNLVKVETSKAVSPFERQALAMMHRLAYDFPDAFYHQHVQERESTLGIITSGGTLANVTALWCARNQALGRKGSFGGVEDEGLAGALASYGYRDAVIIGSRLMHYSFEKAAGVLGIGTSRLLRVPIDRNNRIDISRLRETIDECRTQNRLIIALVGIAGTTETGSIDPLEEMGEIAAEHGIHFHVDAAWGGPVLFSQRHRVKLAGLRRADSITIDGHKQMYLPMGIGMILLRDPLLARVIEKQARYILRAGSADLGKRALEGSRPGMAFLLHAALKIIGRQGYELLIDDNLRKTLYMADVIRARPEFELLVEPQMNVLTYRFIPEELRRKARCAELTISEQEALNEINQKLQRLQRQAGSSFVSRTTLSATAYGDLTPVVALRVVIANPLTTEADIVEILNEQVGIASRLG